MTTPSNEQLSAELRELREQLAELKAEKRRRSRWLVGLVLLGATAAFAQLTTFQPNTPARADQVNANFTQLKTWLEQKVGTAGTANIVATTPMRVQLNGTNNANLPGAIVATAGTQSGISPILEVMHDNQTQGISLGYNTIAAVGSNGSVDLNLVPQGSGRVIVSEFAAATEVGYELSCGEGGNNGGSVAGNPFCCRMNVRTGEVLCTNAGAANGGSWGAAFAYPNLGATTAGRYHLTCQGGTSGTNFPFCCRINANTGSATCASSSSWQLAAGSTSTPF